MKTAGIAGDGILGKLLALALKNAGWRVTLYSREASEPNCSYVAARLLTPIAELENNDIIIFNLGMDAIATHWPSILKQIPEEIYFRQDGSLMISHPRDTADLTRFITMTSSKITHKTFYQSLTQVEIETLEPDLHQVQTGYYFPDEAQIDNQQLLKHLTALLKQHITWKNKQPVIAVAPGIIKTKNTVDEFDIVFDCRGLGADEIFPELRGIRGELIWLHAPDVLIQRPIRYMHPRYRLYIAPRPNHIYIIGASEIESTNNGPISVRTTLELLTAVYCIQPKFAEAQIIKTATHIRPTLANHLPQIKFSERLLAINGLYRHGYLIAPTIIHDVMQWLISGMKAVCYPELFAAIR